MTFASLEFAILLGVCFALYYFLPQRLRMGMLLAASYVFYCHWNPIYGLLILASTLLDYVVALIIPMTRTPRQRKLALLASVVGNLSLLGYFKYTNFALDSLRALLGPLGDHLPGPLQIVLPVGISFYTFQTMSYTIDVYRGQRKPEKDFMLMALYVSFFPQLVAGPIERAGDLMDQLAVRQRFRWQNIEEGLRLFLWGLFKKIVLADRIVQAAHPIYLAPEKAVTGELAFAVLAMLFGIYLDFSAYSEMARGAAQLFGIRLSVNFRFPEVASNIAEFWRRWHITMSTWVRDYLFMPLGGFRPRNLWHQARTTIATMALVGLWHGANWTFVLWGVSHGALLVLYQGLHLRVLRRFRKSRLLASQTWSTGSWVFTTILRAMVSILFFSPDLARAGVVFSGLFIHPTLRGFNRLHIIAGLAVVAVIWLGHYLHFRLNEKKLSIDLLPAWVRGTLYAAFVYVILFGALGKVDDFIYFQF